MNKIEEKKLYAISERISHRYFRVYKKIFVNDSIDLDDLKQETALIVWDTLKNYPAKPQEELEKLVTHAVVDRLNVLRLKSGATNVKDEEKLVLNEGINDEDLTDVEEDEPFFFLLPLREKGYIKDENKDDSETFFSEIKKFCSDREYNILCKKFMEHKTLKEIGDEIQLTAMGVRVVLNKTLSRLKKQLVKELR